MAVVIVSLFIFALLVNPGLAEDDFLYETFQESFIWGVATASYQIEGAWNISGKLRSY